MNVKKEFVPGGKEKVMKGKKGRKWGFSFKGWMLLVKNNKCKRGDAGRVSNEFC